MRRAYVARTVAAFGTVDILINVAPPYPWFGSAIVNTSFDLTNGKRLGPRVPLTATAESAIVTPTLNKPL